MSEQSESFRQACRAIGRTLLWLLKHPFKTTFLAFGSFFIYLIVWTAINPPGLNGTSDAASTPQPVSVIDVEAAARQRIVDQRQRFVYDSIEAAVLEQRFADHEYWLGMTIYELKKSLGKPDNINRTVTTDGSWEQWVYYEMVAPDHRGQAITYGDIMGLNKKVWSGRSKYFYFVEGILTTWQDYK
jgi:hypothetical protein